MFKIKKKLNNNIEKLLFNLESKNMQEIIYLLGNKKEIVKRNFLAGLFRGIGIGIGVTLITSIIIYIFQKIVRLNLPIIGKYLHDLFEIINTIEK